MKQPAARSRKKAPARRARPAADQDRVTVRLAPKLGKAIDAWARRQPDRPSLPVAIQRLLAQALDSAAPGTRGLATRRASRAESLAGAQIDRMQARTDQSDDVKAKRKERLLKGPPEFRK